VGGAAAATVALIPATGDVRHQQMPGDNTAIPAHRGVSSSQNYFFKIAQMTRQ